MSESVESGGYSLSTSQFERFRALVRKHAGIHLRDEKKQLVCSRLSKRLRSLGLDSFDDYYDLVTESDAEGDELQALVNAITTNKTSFYREAHHFEELQRLVVKPLVTTSRGGGIRFRAWSAGSSTGEEAYTILMSVCSVVPQWEASDISVLASDIDTNVLQTGARGVYPDERLDEIPGDLAARWCIRGSGDKAGLIRMRRALRERVQFERINFIEPQWPVDEEFDAIFCRNALIYFDQPTQVQIVSRLVRFLRPNGLLFLGHSESGVGARPELRSLGRTAYRRVDSAA
jgi:chemotaxis protein methyltransferase CheR